VTGQAGQPGTLAQGLRKIGVDAESVSIRDHAFGYRSDRRIDISGIKTLTDLHQMLAGLALEYDVFHFHAQSFFMLWPALDSPSLQDIFILKMLGKKVFFHFRGQEIRNSATFRSLNPFHYVDEPAGNLFTKIPDGSKELLRTFVGNVCDGMFAVDEELRTYVPGAEIVPRALDAEGWDFVGVEDRDTPIIVHAPSRRGVKGTQYVLDAVEKLRGEGLRLELRLVEHMNHDEAREVYRSADIVVDQLRIGWYGVLAVEALALGKPVVCYIRDDLWERHGASLPVVNANPATIADALRPLILDKALRRQLSERSRAYFDRTHDSTMVARQLEEIYRRPLRSPNVSAYVRLLDHQQALLRRGRGASPLPSLAGRSRATRLIAEFMRIRRAEGSVAALRAFQAWQRRRR